MASSSGTSSVSSLLQNSGGSEENLQLLVDQRKRKRMISNRESARRSRMRKQKHLDDLMTQLSQLRKENNQIISSMRLTTQHYHKVEAENSILRAQVAELSHRLQSLNEIINCLNYNPINASFATEEPYTDSVDEFMNNYSLSYLYVNQQPILASADMVQY